MYNKSSYQTPAVEIVCLSEDIITTSTIEDKEATGSFTYDWFFGTVLQNGGWQQ